VYATITVQVGKLPQRKRVTFPDHWHHCPLKLSCSMCSRHFVALQNNRQTQEETASLSVLTWRQTDFAAQITEEVDSRSIHWSQRFKRYRLKLKAKAKAQVLGIAPLNMRSTCQRRFTSWKWCLINTGYSSLVRRKLSGAHSPRNGLWTSRCFQRAYYAPINHARPSPRNPCT